MKEILAGIEELKMHVSERLDTIEKKLDRIIRIKSVLDGDELIDNQDLCQLLGVTKRTVQRYRNLKLIPFYKIDGKMYYRKSEVMDFFKNHNQRKKDGSGDEESVHSL